MTLKNYILDIKYIIAIILLGGFFTGFFLSNLNAFESVLVDSRQQTIKTADNTEGNKPADNTEGDNLVDDNIANSAIDDNIASFELENGLKVILLKDNRLPVVTHSIWYRVGAVDEEKGSSGIAHYLEHLMFKGTEQFPEGKYSKIIAANGGESNAFTSFDYTAYYAQIPKEHLPLVMQMEADRMVNLNINKKEAATELEVVREERKQRNENNPENKHRENIFATLFQDTPYQDPIIGWDQDLQKLTLKKAFQFYKQNYMPQNTTLVISGNISAAEVKNLSLKYYGKIKNQTKKPNRCDLELPMPEVKNKYLEEKHPDILKPSWSMLFNTNGANKNLNHIAALQIIFYVIGGGQNSRLYKKLVVEDKTAITAGAYFSTLRYGGIAEIAATPAQDITFKKIEKDINQVLENIKLKNISLNELKRAKNQLEARIIYKIDDQLGHAFSIGKFVMNCHRIEDFKKYVDIINNISLADIRNIASLYLKDQYKLVANIQKGDENL